MLAVVLAPVGTGRGLEAAWGAETNRQPPTTTKCHQPPITNHQPPPTASRQPPTANRQSPPTMVEHMSYIRSFCKTAVQEHFFFLLRTPLPPRFAQMIVLIIVYTIVEHPNQEGDT